MSDAVGAHFREGRILTEEVEGVVMAQVYMVDFLIESPRTVDMAAHRKTALIRKLHRSAALACLQGPLVRRDPDLSMVPP